MVATPTTSTSRLVAKLLDLRDHLVRELLDGHGAPQVAVELGVGVAVDVEHVELLRSTMLVNLLRTWTGASRVSSPRSTWR